MVFFPHRLANPKTMVYLHKGILRSREKEGSYTLFNSMDGTGEHYAKRFWHSLYNDITLPMVTIDTDKMDR